MFTGNPDAAHPVEIFDPCLLPGRTPSAPHAVWYFSKFADGMRSRVARFQQPSAQKAQLAMIEIVAVKVAQQHSGCAGSHEAVQRLREKCRGRRKTDLVCQIPSQRAFPCAGIVRLSDTRQ